MAGTQENRGQVQGHPILENTSLYYCSSMCDFGGSKIVLGKEYKELVFFEDLVLNKGAGTSESGFLKFEK